LGFVRYSGKDSRETFIVEPGMRIGSDEWDALLAEVLAAAALLHAEARGGAFAVAVQPVTQTVCRMLSCVTLRLIAPGVRPWSGR
jgi:hypothetical protein